MGRPAEPQKKQELLEQCLSAAIEAGTLDASINSIAKKVGTSGRMLVYHFGSRQELEQQLIGLLETRLRDKLWAAESVSTTGADGLVEHLLEMWDHLTSTGMHGLMKLTMELNQRAIQGNPETQRFIEHETEKWVDLLLDLTHEKTTALLLFHLFQGAILDFLTTGNAQRGRQSIKAFTDTLR